MPSDQLKELWRVAFGDGDALIDAFFATAYSPRRCHSISLAGRITAALYWMDCSLDGQRIAYVYAVATHPEYRGQGLCRRLMTETHAILDSQGYAGVLLSPAGEALEKMYEKMGYRPCCGHSVIRCAAGTPCALRPVTPEEYAALRRQYLPSGGVLQEGDQLRYLSTYAKLYAGDDFLLAALQAEDSLLGLELLGNPQAAPGIVAALGFRQGSFRIPGSDIPYAMYLPLREDAPCPGYLGFAFD